ncbi:MAG: FemAB family PEP-CTERM system-associated protein [Magnetococcales bacterium]|nr:FemAB family PEP-CTERM system-associated protein [Magnetococcales bacterium]
MNNNCPPPVDVIPCQNQDHSRWDAFVEQCPSATFFHKVGWQEVLATTFGHRPYYFLAQRNGKICGVLPLFHVKSLLFGNALSSLPFLVYGGVAATDPEAEIALENKAQLLAQQLNVDHLEMRNIEPGNDNWLVKDLYYTFRKEISADPDANLMAIPRKQRAEVRRGIKKGLTSRIDSGVDLCYDLYAESVRNLGTPVFGRKLFHQIQKVFGEQCQSLIIEHEGKPVCSVLSYTFRDQVLPYYAGATPEVRRLGGFAFMYWDLMNRAAADGARLFDFGRSKKDAGSFKFKKYFGFEPEPLHYQYYLVKADGLPNVSPTNPKYRLFISLWKRLPLPISKVMGPWIARSLG